MKVIISVAVVDWFDVTRQIVKSPFQGPRLLIRISQSSTEAVRLDVIMIVSLWNLTGISTALLSMCL